MPIYTLRNIYLITLSALLCALSLAACGKGHPAATGVDTVLKRENAAKALEASKLPTDNIWLTHLDSMPSAGCIALEVHPPHGHLSKAMRDSNYLHVAAGRQYGITPINEPFDILDLQTPLVHITSCETYYVDSLRHSYPYLVPMAATLLHNIGQAFNDTLRSRGGGSYRIKVTSLLRTPHSISRLRRVNRASVQESSHQFGTTFDVSFANFICDAQTVPRTQADLKNLLAEILQAFRSRGECLVIYEHRPGCFHITATDSTYRRPPPPEPED